jgi:predicted metal-dependent enzyme (double-stranded beta helix superfamily)
MLARVAQAAGAREWRALDAALSEALHEPRWLRPEHRVGDPKAYMRHLLYVDPQDRFVISAITWLPGQSSPVHGHQVWCVFGVAEGDLTEEQFSPAGLKLQKRSVYRAGELADRDLESRVVHRVSNCSRAPIVSLHLYGVAASRVTTGINKLY